MSDSVAKVFISYSSRDREVATYIAEELKTAGSDVFIDYQRLSAGDNFVNTIGVEIEQCHYLLVLLSTHSLESKWVKSEVSYAFNKDKTIIPVLLDGDVEIGADFFFLNTLHFVDLTGWPATDEITEQIENLLSVVSRPIVEATDAASENTNQTPREISNTEKLFYGALVLGHALNQWKQWKNEREQAADDYELSGTLPAPRPKLSVPRSPQAITLENVSQLKPMATLDAHTGAVESIAFSPDGKYLASASNGFMGFQSMRNLFVREKADYSVRLWDVESRKLLQTFNMPEKEILALGFSPDGQLLIVFCKAGFIEFIDVETCQRTAKIEFQGTLKSCAMSSVAFLFATVTHEKGDDELRIWWRAGDGFETDWSAQRSEFRPLQPLGRSTGSSASSLFYEIIAMSGDGRFLMYRHNDGTSTYASKYPIRHIESNEILATKSFSESIQSVASANTTPAFMVNTYDYFFYHFPLNEIGTDFKGEKIKISGWGYDALTYAADDSFLVLGGGDRNGLTAWDVTRREVVAEIKNAHQETIKDIRFSPDGSLLATASHDKTIKLWAIG